MHGRHTIARPNHSVLDIPYLRISDVSIDRHHEIEAIVIARDRAKCSLAASSLASNADSCRTRGSRGPCNPDLPHYVMPLV